MNKLPDKLSELLELALDDLKACEADPKYEIDMGNWYVRKGEVCYVCLAGSVIAQELSPDFARVSLIPLDFSFEISNKLQALNYLELGDIAFVFEVIGYIVSVPKEDVIQYISYSEDGPEDWWEDMNKILETVKRVEERNNL